MNVVYIMRGVPGSGKSTLARKLVNGTGVIHSTDDFFYEGGVYRFNPDELDKNHRRNFQAFCRSLAEGVPVVICDNTNAKHWHFKPYVEAAKRAGYTVAFVVLPHPEAEVAAQRNIHNVPLLSIQRMIREWEN